MTVQMTMASLDSGVSGQGDCDGCGGSEDESIDAVTCSPVLTCCGVPALLPDTSGLAVTQTLKQVIPMPGVVRDLTAPPDPYPPKSSILS